MNEAMEQAMALTGPDQYLEDSPEAPIPIRDQDGQVVEVDPTAIAAEGMAFAGNYMAKNGPNRPNHNLFGARTMTKAQLEEQKMNEAQGYPSPIEEADKTKELETRVAGIETGINQILARLSPPSQRGFSPDGQSSPANMPQSVSIGGNPASQDANTTQAATTTVSPANLTLIDLDESTEPENKQTRQRLVTLKDGKKISVPVPSSRAMGLGPIAAQVDPPQHRGGPDDDDTEVDDWGEDGIAVVELPEAPEKQDAAPTTAEDVERENKAVKLVRIQQLVQDVNAFLAANDVHRFWRRHISRHVHRHVGYSGWPKAIQAEFDVRFKSFLSDPQFVTSVCSKVINMDMGHALGAKYVATFLVSIAGFTAFALCGIDN